MKGVDHMVDVRNVTADVENLQNKSEQRDATEHHVRQIAEQCADKKPQSPFLFRPSSLSLGLRSSARKELWIWLRQKPRTVARLFSHIPSSPHLRSARVEEKPHSLRPKERVKAKAPSAGAKAHWLKAKPPPPMRDSRKSASSCSFADRWEISPSLIRLPVS